ncbi:MAG: hydrogenobyrinic acid a,c-diamide synthase (glutamine-hydrolyzing) [Candidatus Methanomethylophilaceae archaeon]|jgi:cobyrinic acid a,c-diamide synthase|nr:hydrogenobyrinic acid a,c-diamide synthase (glutamine-hydrolyzing) [Candidatus Methanomethylophilaceae archaeon]MDD2936627.1 hydrogenobyrinic acid a,c-diamide synthase (glutamine-hydrolyzing) [Candidatus Methanomethylophilaceae archaeon]MDD3351701.1 hydrogenobyrinic acid a,c-diamide synthase (glutamine-hydrolyzing) [Candidatus Methanomethylophilaceae archaeon]MDD3986165.1 hydrogenobyrinic acid a,c-diamide synthase (glutamine-hydrolyzing) [Candidatus Methanomethylophilaceae archaeon]MDY025181
MKGVVIAGTGSGVGKTSITTGILSRLSKQYKVQSFKAGPDFIDPMYHTLASGRTCRNIDSFMMGDDIIRNIVGYASKDADLCIVEGVRGLYEGFSADSDIGSTARLAKVLGFPVLLTVDVRSLNRSAAAIVNGFAAFDPELDIKGVILNNISGRQHEDKLEEAIGRYCRQEIVGKVRKMPERPTKERYLGLITPNTKDMPDIAPLAEMAEGVDLDRLMQVAESSDSELPQECPYVRRDSGLTAAVPMDDSFCFYYRENIECLEASGVRVKTFSPTDGEPLPDADIYYIGGGYPELHAEEISSNSDFLEGIKNVSEEGRPVLGECGGLLTMCRSLKDAGGRRFGMAGIFDAGAEMTGVRHGPAYVMAKATRENPLFGSDVRAHEYHYSDVFIEHDGSFGYKLLRGSGISGGMDGLVSNNTLGTYMHQHALSSADWASGLISKCG